MEMICEKEYGYLMEKEVTPYLKACCHSGDVLAAAEKHCRKTKKIRERKSTKAPRKLHIQWYLTENPKGVIVISHGFTEAAQKYEELIYYFLKAGYHVYMPEHMGHGLSYRLTDDPSLIYVDSWERYVRDFLKICHGIKKTYPDLHLNLFAHSMGGGIGASAAAWEPELFHKIILSSPMIRPLTGNVPWPLAVMAAWGMCILGKGKAYVAGQKPYDNSETFETSAGSSKARFERYNAFRQNQKELQTCAASYGWLFAAAKMSWYLRIFGWEKLSAPVLFLQAEKDDFVSVHTLQKFAEKIRRKGKAPCEYVSFAATRHEIYSSDDITMKKYMERILNFLGEKSV